MRPPHSHRKVLRLHKFLTILGTLIVFLTFVVKDGLRDRVKDELAAIQAAQAEYWSEKYHEEEMEAIRRGRIKRRLVDVADKSSADKNPASEQGDDAPPDWNPTASEIKAAAEPYLDSRTNLEVEDADVLFLQMPGDREAQTARDKAYSEMKKLNELRQNLELEFQSIRPNADKIPATAKQRDMLESLATQWNASDGAAKQYVETTISRAGLLQASRQHRYDLFTKWSYVLYTVGAVVILAGKLIEREADRGDVESLRDGE